MLAIFFSRLYFLAHILIVRGFFPVIFLIPPVNCVFTHHIALLINSDLLDVLIIIVVVIIIIMLMKNPAAKILKQKSVVHLRCMRLL